MRQNDSALAVDVDYVSVAMCLYIEWISNMLSFELEKHKINVSFSLCVYVSSRFESIRADIRFDDELMYERVCMKPNKNKYNNNINRVYDEQPNE